MCNSWRSDSLLADTIWKVVREHIDPYTRHEVAEAVIKVFEEHTDDVLHKSYQLQKDADTSDYDDFDDDDFDNFDDDGFAADLDGDWGDDFDDDRR